MPVNTTAQGNISISSINTENTSTTSNSLKTLSDTATTGTDPADGAPYGMSEFSGYSHASFNGAGVGNSTFNINTSLVPCSNHPNFDMNINGSSSGLTWEMTHTAQHQTSNNGQVNSTTAMRIGRDITNNRILLLLLKDGDHNTQAGNGNNGMYRILPYVGLGSATWTFKFEYDTTSNQYNSTTGNPKVFVGPAGGPGSLSTNTDFFSVPSQPGIFRTMQSFTGMAENGESLFQDGSSTLLSWIAKVPNNIEDRGASVGRTSFYTNSIPVRLVIKAVNGSDTYTATSNYWSLGVSASKGTIF